MSDQTAEYKIELDTDEAEHKAQSFGTHLAESLVPAELAAKALEKALEVLEETIKHGLEAAVQAEQHAIKFTAALRGLGEMADEAKNALMEQSEALAIHSTVSKESIRDLQLLALHTGIATQDVEKYAEASLRLANVTGQDLNSAFHDLIMLQQMGKTRNEQLRGATSDLTKEQIAHGAAIDRINEKWGEQLDILTKGTGGAAKSLAMAWDEVGEAMGHFALKGGLVESALNTMTGALRALRLQIEEPGVFLDLIKSAMGVGLSAGDQKHLEESVSKIWGTGATPAAPYGGETHVGGLDSAGGAKKKRDDMFAGFLGPQGALGDVDMVALDDGTLVPKEDFEKWQDAKMEADKAFEDRRRDMVEAQYDYQKALEEKRTKETQKQSDERKKILEREMAFQKQIADIGIGIAVNFSRMALDAIFARAEGEKVKYREILYEFLKNQGKQLIGSGIAHELEALAMLAINPADPRGAELLAIGGLEFTTGTAMAAGSLAVGKGGKGGGGAAGGSGGGSGGMGDLFNASGHRAANQDQQTQQSGPMVVNLYGIMGKDAGREIEKALVEARRKGRV